MLKEYIIFGKKYKLISTINTPEYNHYNAIIIDILPNIKNLKCNSNYLYDGLKNENSIVEIKNLKDCLEKVNPYIGIYFNIDNN